MCNGSSVIRFATLQNAKSILRYVRAYFLIAKFMILLLQFFLKWGKCSTL